MLSHRAAQCNTSCRKIKRARRGAAGSVVFSLIRIVAVSLRHGHLLHSAETLGLAPRPNLEARVSLHALDRS
jgi:hypothetical protein